MKRASLGHQNNWSMILLNCSSFLILKIEISAFVVMEVLTSQPKIPLKSYWELIFQSMETAFHQGKHCLLIESQKHLVLQYSILLKAYSVCLHFDERWRCCWKKKFLVVSVSCRDVQFIRKHCKDSIDTQSRRSYLKKRQLKRVLNI